MTEVGGRRRRTGRAALRAILALLAAAGLGIWYCPPATLELIAVGNDLEALEAEVARLLRQVAEAD